MRLVTVVTDTDEGKVAFTIDLVGGGVSTVTAGKPPRGEKPDVTVTVKESVILEIWSGARTRDAAFMRGDLKVEGAYERWLDEVVPLFQTPQCSVAWEAAAR
jgi:putative sterol carrier protein